MPRTKKKKIQKRRSPRVEEDDLAAEEMESDRAALSEDDCQVEGDEDCDDVGYEGEAEKDGNHEEVCEEDDGNRLGVEEEECEDFVAEFGEVARDDEDVSDAESGDDIWDDVRIPDPLSDSDDEDPAEDADARHEEPEDPEEVLKLGKTFSSPDEFKIVVLRYSLKTRYDIKLYRSQALKVGAKCSDTKDGCQWRCYCSYDKKKQKIQIKVYESKHICVRSGYSKMLKRGIIAWLFS